MNYTYTKENTLEYGVLYYLDIGTVSDAEYDKLKPIIEHLGGHWREKVQKFVFREDVGDILFDCIENGVDVTEKYKWQEQTQFFPTPSEVAKRVVQLADIQTGMSVLEPSAGRGNLVDEINVPCDILCIEPVSENVEYLEQKGYKNIKGYFEDFVNTDKRFDRIIMNPPFSGQRDIIHLMLAYGLLKKGGIVTSIISENALYYKTEVSDRFREFLKAHDGYVENVKSNAFEKSGTTIETVIVKFIKK